MLRVLRAVSPVFPLLLACAPGLAQNCANTSTGAVPLPQLGLALYRGFPGGLYPQGANQPPAAHAAAGLAAALRVQPLDAQGVPHPGGRIVLLAIGMSNTTQEYAAFKATADADPARNPAVLLVDGAQGGQDARIIQNPAANFWTVVDQRLAAAGASRSQVQAVWLKEAVANPTLPFPQHAQELEGFLVAICQILKSRFANLQLTHVSTRSYGGYALGGRTNPEPYAYETGFAVKWLIERQIQGDPALNHDPARGAVRAAWLGWGPYFWADGTRASADGLFYLCEDYASDGIHPSPAGRNKVLARLDRHWHTDPTAVPWYRAAASTRATLHPVGLGCPGSRGALQSGGVGTPWLGNSGFALGLGNAAAGVPLVALVGATRGQATLDRNCSLLVDPGSLWAVLALTSSGTGAARLPLPIPAQPALQGLRIATQWVALDPASSNLAWLGGGAVASALELGLGTP
ncbi:MAG: hypothetical protein IT458_18470 [Planctomycetes bacterium]|nr:hypothetical protein [Planctomycetota bacterium]